MAGLFGIPTPQEIRAQIGKTGREQDLSLASLPAGRGGVALSSQLGRFIGGAITGPSPEEQAAAKQQEVSASIQAEAEKQEITSEENPVEFATLAAKMFVANGMNEPAAKALQFATQFDKLLNVSDTNLTNEVKQQIGLGPQDKISDNPEAKALLNRLQLMRNQRQPRVNEGGTPSASSSFKNATDNFVKKIFKEGVEFSFESRVGDKIVKEKFTEKDFVDNAEFIAFSDFVADQARTLQEDVKQAGGGKSLSPVAARKKAFDKAKPFLDVVGVVDKDLSFDAEAAANSLFSEEDKVIDFNAVGK